jgi:hypothetical protein
VIRRVEVNPAAASVLVLYDPVDSAAIAQLGSLIIPCLDLDVMARPAEVTAGLAHMDPAEYVAGLGRQLNRKIGAATGGVLDLKLLLPASLVVGGLIRLMAARKVPCPTWCDFLWFAFGTYFTLNRGGCPEAPSQAGRLARKKPRRNPTKVHPVATSRTGN